MERIEETGFGNIRLIQDTDGFCYGIDAVILADFTCRIRPDFKMAVDLGSGNGIIPFILSHKNKDARFIGVEVQEAAVRLAEKSCALNCLQSRISFVNGDISSLNRMVYEKEDVDVVTCNPPYFARGGGIPPENKGRFIARHETTAEVGDFIKTAADILDGSGDLFMVHRPSRLVDIFCSCREYGLEPKTIRYVIPRAGEIPNIVLIHCVAGGGRELRMMRELPVYGSNGQYSDEIMDIYERKTSETGGPETCLR